MCMSNMIISQIYEYHVWIMIYRNEKIIGSIYIYIEIIIGKKAKDIR